MKKGFSISKLDESFLTKCTTADFIVSGYNAGSYTKSDNETITEFYDNICSAAFDLARIENVQFSTIWVIIS